MRPVPVYTALSVFSLLVSTLKIASTVSLSRFVHHSFCYDTPCCDGLAVLKANMLQVYTDAT